MDRMIEILRGIDADAPSALQEALELASDHPRLRMLEGYVVKTYVAPFC